jgi:phosphoglycolate phosphatase-like HAD superfamily hydrolase
MGEAVSEYDPDLAARFVQYHKDNGGISRYEKFDHFLRKIVNNYSEEEYKRLLERLSNLVRDKLVTVPLTNGAFNFINHVYQQSHLYIVSGGDQVELRDVFRQRDMDKYFHGIFGSPTSKVDHCKNIVSNFHSAKKGLLIGDSHLDYIAAKSCGFDFVFISGYTDMDDWLAFCTENGLRHHPDLKSFSKDIT